MAKTLSTMLELGTVAPSFNLPNTEGNLISLSNFPNSSGYLIMFICNHCPYVIHMRDELKKLTDEYMKKNIAVIAINSNDIEKYPDDSPAKMAIEKKNQNYNFPYLFDATQEVAKSYKAACTPDFFLFNKEKVLVYRGQFDDSRPNSGKIVTGKDLREALDAMIEKREISDNQIPSMGCNIKWKEGNEPKYF